MQQKKMGEIVSNYTMNQWICEGEEPFLICQRICLLNKKFRRHTS